MHHSVAVNTLVPQPRCRRWKCIGEALCSENPMLPLPFIEATWDVWQGYILTVGIATLLYT